jgi:hypothetical protein
VLELEPGLALVELALVELELALVVQAVGPVAVIQQGIIRRQVEQLLERRRRDRPGNQRQQHRQSASSSDAPRSSKPITIHITPRRVNVGAPAGVTMSSRLFGFPAGIPREPGRP